LRPTVGRDGRSSDSGHGDGPATTSKSSSTHGWFDVLLVSSVVGRIRQQRTDREFELRTQTFVGRSGRADLTLDDEFVSSMHAALQWTGNRWEVRDLGSRNGTAHNGEPVAPATVRQLTTGDEVSFGRASVTWTVVDDSGPQPIATDAEGGEVVGQGGLLALPGPEEPRATIYFGPGGTWQVDSDGEMHDVEDGGVVEADGRRFTLSLPRGISRTRNARGTRPLSLGEVALRITIADDGGEVTVAVEGGVEPVSFRCGAQGRLIVYLARARVADEAGWVDRDALLEAFRIGSRHLSVAVYRARRLFTSAGFVDAAQIIERDAGRLRLGTARLELRPS